MNLHEYQAKELLRKYEIQTPYGQVAETLNEVNALAKDIKNPVVLKAQIHAGGRGKSGGVKVVKSKEEALEFSSKLLGKNLVTYQNQPSGQPVHKILFEETEIIINELYFSILIDREEEKVCLVVSSAGGMEIEEISKKSPDLILKEFCNPITGLMDYQTRELANSLKFSADLAGKFNKFAKSAYKLFTENNLSLLEINPLVINDANDFVALDCKISIDDNALYKQKKLSELRDWSQDDSKEAEAHHAGLNYIALNGDIGCMVNGAGLAMATMDLIQHSGGSPANFLDVGGGASAETVSKAFRILLSDKNVKVVLVNIFGGIMRCDVIAEGIINSAKDVGVSIPIVVRLEGTNVDDGKKLLKESNLNIHSADNLTDAAKIAVTYAKDQK
ncbi:succinyl-CoA synthetase subunit beta [Methylophilales bacterium MBRSG12]|uniref:Succinate--CoA ligase [ADP-forming] subunit beta n=1 Tax=Methylophilales bacterium MBRS-H7 TaxID=1623450 RepID=A0A0H4JAC3_9PROT|nr:succinyl-CoA synthetase subunit beta [Methylophilales bacterium MBRSF5]AKO65452.1 succinyl-CoA synthetase subunit beta [Methylophilales bacterium MBRS-H7]AKO66772.1 succinyl-CoA synthetase subunit beta [Methylophilales bacterium MBRSG12]